MRILFFCLFCVFVLSCNHRSETLKSELIVNKSILVSGTDKLFHSELAFDFRDKHYKAKRKDGRFNLERYFTDSTSVSVSKIRDVLSNDGFKRYVDGKELLVSDELAQRYSASVNSVHYFSVLPYGLNDEAVVKTRLEDVTINEALYHTIQITFNEEGGGEDFEDIFIYWIHSETFKIDYLAYSYNEDDGKGMRFREAYNERYVKGVRFVDYNNYKPNATQIQLTDLLDHFAEGKLTLLSKIELKNVALINM